MLRNIGAVVAGLVVGMCVNMAFVMLNTMVLFPMPAGTDMSDQAAFTAYIETLPATAYVVVLVAHLGQSFTGGWVAARLADSKPMVLAMIIGVLSLLGGIMNAMSVPMPAWMYVEMPLYLAVAWLAGRIEVKRRTGGAS